MNDKVKICPAAVLAGCVLLLYAAAFLYLSGAGVVYAALKGPASLRARLSPGERNIREAVICALFALAGALCLWAVIHRRGGAWIKRAAGFSLAGAAVLVRGMGPTWGADPVAYALAGAVGALPIYLCGVWWSRRVERAGGPGRVREWFPFFQRWPVRRCGEV